MLRRPSLALVLVTTLGGCPPSPLDPIVTGSSSGTGTTHAGDPSTGTSAATPTTGTDTGAASTEFPGPGTSTGTTGATSTSEAATTSSATTTPVDTTRDPQGTSTGPVLDTSSESSTGGTSTGSSDETTATTTGEPATPAECLDAKQLLQLPELAVEDGLEQCANGQIHRHTAVQCVHPLVVDLCADPMKCDECDEYGDGVCNKSFENTCRCRYPCESDADCADNAACLCNAGVPEGNNGYHHYVTISQCYPAECRTDADCGGFQCGLSPGICGYGTVAGLFCRGPADECQTDQECFDKQLGNLCWFEKTKGHWACFEQAFCE